MVTQGDRNAIRMLEQMTGNPLYVAIVGSRGYAPLDDVRRYVQSLPSHAVVVSGGARGVDSVAETAANAAGLETIVYPAEWDKYGKSAGYRRNHDIVQRADIVVAFWDGQSRGTQHSMGLAKKNNKPLYVNPTVYEPPKSNMQSMSGGSVMSAQVVNKHHLSNWQNNGNYVYIGRGSKWGNPYTMTHGRFSERHRVIGEYALFVLQNKSLMAALHELEGKSLVCYCAPDWCHGHVLAALARPHVWRGQRPDVSMIDNGTTSLWNAATTLRESSEILWRSWQTLENSKSGAEKIEARAKVDFADAWLFDMLRSWRRWRETGGWATRDDDRNDLAKNGRQAA